MDDFLPVQQIDSSPQLTKSSKTSILEKFRKKQDRKKIKSESLSDEDEDDKGFTISSSLKHGSKIPGAEKKEIFQLKLCHPMKRSKYTEFRHEENGNTKVEPEEYKNSSGTRSSIFIPLWAPFLEKAYAKTFQAFWNVGSGGGSVRTF